MSTFSASGVRVIVSSGIRSSLNVEGGLAELRVLGLTTVLAKPYVPESILNAVHEALTYTPGEPGSIA